MSYERENIAKMAGYVPGEQPEDADVVKLNTNENPYPPPRAVMQALAGVTADQLRRYPNPTARKFREAAAKVHGVKPDEIIAVNGGDELLRLVVSTFVDPHQVVGYADPSYSLYPVLAAAQDAKVFRIPLDDDWHLPADYVEQLNRVGAKLAFVVNPHAPSGRLTPVNDLRRIAEGFAAGVLVIDEAYVDFVDPARKHDAVQLVRDGLDNVILLRSLSKGYSLAGLRFGYGIGSAKLIKPMLTKTKDSYNTDAISQALAVAAVTHKDQAAETWAAVREQRDRLCGELRGMGLEVAESQSNFILVTISGRSLDAQKTYEELKRRKILVRYFSVDPRLADKLRITVGSTVENDVLLRAIKELV
jgi:histidinol-phosphate aminotransferase